MASCFSSPATLLRLVDEQIGLPSARDWVASEETRKEENHTVVTSVYPGDLGDFVPAIGNLHPEKEPRGQYTGRRHLALSDRLGFSMRESELVTRYAGLQG